MAETTVTTPRTWDRTGWLRDGARTYLVGLGVLVAYAVVEWTMHPSSIRPPAPQLRVFGAAVVVLLALVARWQVPRILADRDALVVARLPAARITVIGYGLAAVVLAVAAVRLDADAFALACGALAMTSPGVLLVVLDGSPPLRGVLRVLLAAALVPVATVAGYAVGFLAFWVSTFIGSFVFGVLAGHLVTFVPLALVGPGPHGQRP